MSMLVRSGPPGRGFTLVELLVVVAILALLISVLLPSLSMVRRQTRSTICGTTLRELARGWALYAEQHGDVLVSGRPATLPGNNLYWVGNGWKLRPRWHIALGAAVDIYAFETPRQDGVHQSVENRLLVCPEVPEWTSERNTSYGYNFQFLGNTRQMSDAPRFIRFPVLWSSVIGDTIIMADSMGTAAHFPARERRDNRPDGGTDLRALGYHAFMLDPPRLTPDSDTCDNGNRGYRSGPDDRHAGRVNFAFADGHVARLLPRDAGYGVRPDGSYEHTGPLVHNRRFSGTGLDDDPPPHRTVADPG